MKKLIYTSYSPNTRFSDLMLNVVLIFSPWRLLRGNCVSKIEEFFRSNFNKSYGVFTFNYARSGMLVLFKSLGLSRNDEILAQGFTCIAAINPILWSGLKIKYVDTDRDTGNMDLKDLERKVSRNTKAVMFQHTFGNSKDVEKVASVCKKNDLLLIEDCTNTILGKHGDKYIGTFGDVAIFSFGRDKAVSGVNGGVILINNKDTLEVFNKNYENVKYPSSIWILKELFYPIIWFLIKKTFNIKIGKFIHFIFTRSGVLTRATSSNEKKGMKPKYIPCKLPNSLACLAANQLKDIDEFNKHRVKINSLYEQKLKDIKEIKFFEYEEGNVLLRFPIKVENRDKLTEYLRDSNVYVGDWYSGPVVPIETSLEDIGYVKGMCKKSESICNEIINLPNHINVTEEDALRIICLIKDFYGY